LVDINEDDYSVTSSLTSSHLHTENDDYSITFPSIDEDRNEDTHSVSFSQGNISFVCS